MVVFKITFLFTFDSPRGIDYRMLYELGYIPFFMSADILKNLALLNELNPIIKLEQRNGVTKKAIYIESVFVTY
jgi:hypothetical protein